MSIAAVETYTNLGAGTVSGGTDAPASGTPESWTVDVTTAFPVASTTASPPTVFRVADPAAPTEIMLVTVAPGGTGSGQAWTVTRGAEGTTPVTHVAGFTVEQVLTAGGLGAFVQNPMDALGDIIYGGASGTPTRLPGNTSTRTKVWSQTGTGTASAAPALIERSRSSVNIIDKGADPTGVSDSTAAIAAAIAASSGEVYGPAGTYLVSGIVLNASQLLTGDGAATQFVPASGITGPIITHASDSTVRRLRIYGGTATRANNPAADAISIPAGATRMRVEDVDCMYVNGWVINPASITAALHLSVSNIFGTNNGGGIQLTAASGVTSQAAIENVNLQQCELNPVFYANNVYDLLVDKVNGSVLGSAGIPTMHLTGNTDGAHCHKLDLGVQGAYTAGVPVLLIDDNTGSPHLIDIIGSSFQQGGIGVQVAGGANRITFVAVATQSCGTDGWQFTGTGTGIQARGCSGSSNNSSAATGYDVNVTGLAHVLLDAFVSYSTGVTDAITLPATNHVTVRDPTYPGGGSLSGIPGGW